MRAALVISPHLDDAVLSVGQFLAGRPDAVVATVFAGTPRAKNVSTTYDAKCGFRNAQEAMDARRAEDIEAMSILGAKPVHLGFVDSQYGKPTDQDGMAKVLRQLIEETDPELVVGPLGLVHPDHVLVREALLEATEGLEVPVWLYEELPARVTVPAAVTEALEAIREHGYETEMGFIGTGSIASKMDALFCYRSQMILPEFENRHCLLVPERFHQVVRHES